MERVRWSWVAGAVMAATSACGTTTSRAPGSSSGDEAGSAAGGGSSGGASAGGSSAGTSPAGASSAGSLGLQPSGGTAAAPTVPGGGAPDFAEGGALPDYPEVRLCLDDEQIPTDWGAGGAGLVDVGITRCAPGVVGEFVAQDCLYRLLDPVPSDVDPFSGGHSHCCYLSQLVTCTKR
jgi:hypothetical protein